MGYLPIPKSAHRDRILQNTQFFDIVLDSDDLSVIDELKTLGRIVADPDDPPF